MVHEHLVLGDLGRDSFLVDIGDTVSELGPVAEIVLALDAEGRRQLLLDKLIWDRICVVIGRKNTDLIVPDRVRRSLCLQSFALDSGQKVLVPIILASGLDLLEGCHIVLLRVLINTAGRLEHNAAVSIALFVLIIHLIHVADAGTWTRRSCISQIRFASLGD